MMFHTLVVQFDSPCSAMQARAELVNSGFNSEDTEIYSAENMPSAVEGLAYLSKHLALSPDEKAVRRYASAIEGGAALLRIHVDDAERVAQARKLIAQHQSLAVDAYPSTVPATVDAPLAESSSKAATYSQGANRSAKSQDVAHAIDANHSELASSLVGQKSVNKSFNPQLQTDRPLDSSNSTHDLREHAEAGGGANEPSGGDTQRMQLARVPKERATAEGGRADASSKDEQQHDGVGQRVKQAVDRVADTLLGNPDKSPTPRD